MKMICSILLLLSLTSCVSGAFVVNVTQTSYQAEENHNITLEWMFTTRTNSSSKSLFIICLLSAEPRPLVLFHLREGVEDPESQDEQFTGRVRWDKDVLRDGRIRLHMSRLRINDSGWYQCDVQTGDDSGSEECHLDVTDYYYDYDYEDTWILQPERPTMSPQPESGGMIALYVGLGLTALLALCAGLYFLRKHTRRPIRGNTETDVQPNLNDPVEVTPLEERGQREEMMVTSSM
ncbi:uncharacterized protein LOC119481846 isoform X14 [Sebastes umbrosus]|uniref:uncharacterized protein LOC119481846 isoform X14 n=1 Tax=Sebastes umbrosus TaxID=72105 RepID=UPI0018A12280|nr:uncharacterized protein LOC119481846 isoform X14 [Sebastes umbrosus]